VGRRGVAAELAAVAVAVEAAMVPDADAVTGGPGVPDDDRLRAVEGVAAVVRALPRAAADEDVAEALERLGNEAVSQPAVLLEVVVAVSVAVDHRGVGALVGFGPGSRWAWNARRSEESCAPVSCLRR
jgi:hypothetical protein